jgi:uncharacterized membrane protein YfcA
MIGSLEEWGLLLAAAAFVGMGKAGFGGVAMISVIFFAMVFPARESTGAILPVLITADLLAVWAYARHVLWRQVLLLLPTALAGILTGYLLMPRIPAETFAAVIGWLILFFAVLSVALQFRPALRNITISHPVTGRIMGFFAGITTMLANAAGPILALYLLACRLPKMQFVGTAAWYFLLLNVCKVPFSASLGLITPGTLWLALGLVPMVALGFGVGRWLLGKIQQRTFEALMLFFAVAGAVHLILMSP